ncbi:endolytic transglycosylase MltG [Candidatus Uhrbacteria bacterium]|nr:endolytic transglycosylase MltG [Candidatus Uhrbacteria bacterium]
MGKLLKFALIAALGYGIYVILFGTPDLKAPAQVEIPKGAGVSDIAVKLKDAEIIRSKLGFETLVWLMRASSKLQAGEYKFEPKELGLADIVRALTQGLGASNEREITVIEGWGVDDIGAYLEAQGIGTKREFFEVVGKECKMQNEKCKMVNEFDFLKDKPASVGLEGYLFPDTYRVQKDAKVEEVVKIMIENFDKKLTVHMRADIGDQGKDIFDVVRMASIIEAEVPHEEDRPVIAGILWKRLDIGMALQVDSTLNYATGGKNRALTAEELKIDSPYNTYKHRGLPPTPIGNPGLSAIRAAIYPRHTAYLYFLSDKEGKTHFAKTLDEHNENKARYLR